MDRESVLKGLEVMTAALAKRKLEPAYDALWQTELGQRLNSLGAKQKRGVEFLAYLLLAFLDQKIQTDSHLGGMLKEIGTDFVPEMTRRLINGKNLRQHLASTAKDNAEKDLLLLLAELDDEQLSNLVLCLSRVPNQRRPAFLNIILGMTPDEFKKLGCSGPGRLDTFFRIVEDLFLEEPEGKSNRKGAIKEGIETVEDKLDRGTKILRSWRMRKEAARV